MSANRWLAETGGTRGPAYAERFQALADAGQDMHGEARFVAALLEPGSRVLDAGCGTGRLGIELARLGHDVIGVDLDDSMLEEARRAAPKVSWRHGDLLDVLLPDGGFDLIAAPGNVLVYLTPGTEAAVVARLAAQLRPGGQLVAGFRAEPHLTPVAYDDMCQAAGLVCRERWSSWDRAAYPGDGYLVSVYRAP